MSVSCGGAGPCFSLAARGKAALDLWSVYRGRLLPNQTNQGENNMNNAHGPKPSGRASFPRMLKITLSLLALTALISGCGGGGSGSSSAPSGSSSYQVGGTLTGLSSGTSVTLKNGSDSLMLNSNGSFAFPTQETSGITYDVTVGTDEHRLS